MFIHAAAFALLPAIPMVDDVEPCETSGYCYLTELESRSPQEGGAFASSVAMRDGTTAFGAPGEDACEMYRLEQGVWVLTQRIESPTHTGARFGAEVVLGEGVCAIAAPAAHVDGVRDAGAVYLYTLEGDTWVLAQELVSGSSSGAHTGFGSTLGIDGDELLVGRSDSGSGAAELFVPTANGWALAPDALPSTQAVPVLAKDGARVVLGDAADTSVDPGAGALWVAIPGALPVMVELSGHDAGDRAGTAVAAEDDWLVVSMPGDDGGTGMPTGSLRILRWEADEGSYREYFVVTPCDSGTVGFGSTLDLNNERLVVGSTGGPLSVYHLDASLLEDEPAPESDDDPQIEAITFPHRLILYMLHGLAPAGQRVSIEGEQVALGAPAEDAAGTGSGAARIASLQSQTLPGGMCPCDTLAEATAYGSGKPGALGVPELGLNRAPVLGEQVLIEIASHQPNAPGWLLVSQQATAMPFDGGELYVATPQVLSLPPAPVYSLPWLLPPSPALCGVALYLQAMFLDDAAHGELGTSQTKGLETRFGY